MIPNQLQHMKERNTIPTVEKIKNVYSLKCNGFIGSMCACQKQKLFVIFQSLNKRYSDIIIITYSESHLCKMSQTEMQVTAHYAITMNNILFVSSSHIFSFHSFLNPSVWIMFYSLQIFFLISLLLFTFVVGTDYLFFTPQDIPAKHYFSASINFKNLFNTHFTLCKIPSKTALWVPHDPENPPQLHYLSSELQASQVP